MRKRDDVMNSVVNMLTLVIAYTECCFLLACRIYLCCFPFSLHVHFPTYMCCDVWSIVIVLWYTCCWYILNGFERSIVSMCNIITKFKIILAFLAINNIQPLDDYLNGDPTTFVHTWLYSNIYMNTSK